MTIVFNWYGPAIPFGILRVVPSYLGLRIYFNQAAYDDAELRDPDNYTIDAIDGTPTDQVHNSDAWNVTPEDVTSPTYVDLDCTDITLDRRPLLSMSILPPANRAETHV